VSAAAAGALDSAARGEGAAAPSVKALGLTRRFRHVTAVRELSFEVGRGELFGIVGPDGAGKTTTLRMLAGVLRPTAGDALVNDVSVTRDPEGVKRGIAYMSQRFGLYADLTVRENLEFYPDLFAVPREARPARLERLYRFSDLGPFESRLAGQLSGGMKQKLALSCALIHEPSVLLLDEPTFGVDPVSRRELWLILHERVAAGVTAVVSTSYLDEAERCDRVALLDGGRIAALDAPQALQARLRGAVIAVSADDPRRAAAALRAIPGVRRSTLFGDSVHATLAGGAADWPRIRAALEAGGVVVRRAEPVEPSLEDVFMELTAAAGAPPAVSESTA
jgi:ABC-2 type transport system ATP-binding protein